MVTSGKFIVSVEILKFSSIDSTWLQVYYLISINEAESWMRNDWNSGLILNADVLPTMVSLPEAKCACPGSWLQFCISFLKLVDFEKDFNRFPRHFVSPPYVDWTVFAIFSAQKHQEGAFKDVENLGSVVIDVFLYVANSCEYQTAWSGLISNWIGSFPASLFKAIGPIADSIWISWGTISWLGIAMISYQVTAIGWLETWVLVGEGESRFKRVSRHFHLGNDCVPYRACVIFSTWAFYSPLRGSSLLPSI
jgi:hypothetical protein